jgi:hypothetical protein
VLVVDVVVVADPLAGITGTNARMFQWLAIQQANFPPSLSWLAHGCIVLVKVVVVVV